MPPVDCCLKPAAGVLTADCRGLEGHDDLLMLSAAPGERLAGGLGVVYESPSELGVRCTPVIRRIYLPQVSASLGDWGAAAAAYRSAADAWGADAQQRARALLGCGVALDRLVGCLDCVR